MSISLNGVLRDVTYTSGISDDFEEQPGAVLTQDPWGMDRITRRFKGRLDKVDYELGKLKRSRTVKDAIYPDLTAVSWTVTHDSPFPLLVIEYAGVVGGKTPDPVFKSGQRAQSVQLAYSGAALINTSESVTVSYQGPYTQAKYLLPTKPKGPKYRSKVEGNIEITKVAGDASRSFNFLNGGSLLGSISASPPGGQANSYNGVVEIITPQFDFEQVGSWWTVTETNEKRIVPLAFGGSNRVVIK